PKDITVRCQGLTSKSFILPDYSTNTETFKQQVFEKLEYTPAKHTLYVSNQNIIIENGLNTILPKDNYIDVRIDPREIFISLTYDSQKFENDSVRTLETVADVVANTTGLTREEVDKCTLRDLVTETAIKMHRSFAYNGLTFDKAERFNLELVKCDNISLSTKLNNLVNQKIHW
ncbi:hypothetical protein GGF37_005852, partial [Kickxella alabastrina]